MDILYTLNNNFVPQVAAGITSVCVNNTGEKDIHFWLMSLGISTENQMKLVEYVSTFHREISFIELSDLQKYFDFSIDTSGWNPIVLARLLLDKLLPEDLERVLYLDGDTIVRGSLRELWNTDMGDHPIAASLEPTYDRKRKASIGLEGKPYCNAGVLLVDLNNWRRKKTGEEILKFYEEHNGKLFSNDQDAINGSQKGTLLILSPKYNYFNIYDQYPYSFLKNLCDYPYIPEEEYNETKKNPVIVHYLGEERPWRIGNHHRFKDDYLKYLNMTPWKGQNMEDGWKLYYAAWDTFNFVTKPFPKERYQVINTLIPAVLKLRSGKNQKSSDGHSYITEEILSEDAGKRNAGGKAREDMIAIAGRYGIQPYEIVWDDLGERNAVNLLKLQEKAVKEWNQKMDALYAGDTLYVQFPTVRYFFFLDRMLKKAKKNGVRIILLIHDIESLRNSGREEPKGALNRALYQVEQGCFACADLIVSHNSRMTGYLIRRGIPSRKIRNLGIFDYLIPGYEGKEYHGDHSLIVAGNLSDEKSGYIQKIPQEIDVNLYGGNYEDHDRKNLHYHGSFAPDDLIRNMSGGFGLVWDGSSVKRCEGVFGNYMRYNNPHKMSLYLAAGFPVIIWKEAALASFVKKNHCGICVDSLEEVPGILKKLSDAEYESMKKNAEKIGRELREGVHAGKIFGGEEKNG